MRNLFAAAALLLALQPAFAWEHVLNDYGNGQVLNAATAYDHTGSAALIFGCLMGQGSFHLQLTTASPRVAQADAEAIFLVAGYPLRVAMLIGEAKGHMTASASSDTIDAAEIARAVYIASDPVEITFQGQTYVFDGGGFSDEALAAMLDACA